MQDKPLFLKNGMYTTELFKDIFCFTGHFDAMQINKLIRAHIYLERKPDSFSSSMTLARTCSPVSFKISATMDTPAFLAISFRMCYFNTLVLFVINFHNDKLAVNILSYNVIFFIVNFL